MSLFRAKMPARLALDVAMAAGFIVSLAFRLTGGGPHEIVGLGVCALFVIHCALNQHWFKTWNKGRYDFRRSLSSCMNLLLIFCMAVLCVTGLMNSRYLLGFLRLEGGLGVRQLHSFAAYWGLVLVGAHLGLHWQKVLAALRAFTSMRPRAARGFLPRLPALSVALYGIWSFHERDMAAKLFQGFGFDFWDPEHPSVLFYTHNLAMIGLWACCAHYGLKLARLMAETHKNRLSASRSPH